MIIIRAMTIIANDTDKNNYQLLVHDGMATDMMNIVFIDANW